MGRNPIEQFLRDRAARQVRQTITEERGGDYKANRTGQDYIRSFLGLHHLFRYVSRLKTRRGLDCGAGNTLGISQLVRQNMVGGLEFFATVLRPIDKEVRDYLGERHTFRTPVETLKALGTMQFGVILALNSVAYSKAPELAIASIDQHLEPGGVFKGTFLKKGFSHHLENWSTHETFTRQFRQLGYDVAVASNPADKKVDVVLAVKPRSRCTAAQLLNEDLADWTQQFRRLRK